MTRLIVEAEVVHAWDEALGSLESGAGRGIVVSVTRDSGRPARKLATANFEVHWMPPMITKPAFDSLQIAALDEQLPGIYVLLVGGSQALAMQGKHVFAIVVQVGEREGQTLAALEV